MAWDAAGASNGTSWADAYPTIQAAVDNSTAGDWILIKQGTYGVTNHIEIGPGTNLTIRGGYAGVGTPGPVTNDPDRTVITRADSAARLMWIGGAGGTVEALTFAEAHSDGSFTPYHGAALYLDNATTVFTNCVIRDNVLSRGHGDAGGAYITGGSPSFYRCLFRDNTCGDYSEGGAIRADNASVTLDNCVLEGSITGYDGGAVWFSGTHVSFMRNCLVRENVTGRGGTVYLYSGTLHMENCTVVNNQEIGLGRRSGTFTATNCIAWNNGDDVAGIVTLVNCCIEDTDVTGTDIINDNPLFEYGHYLSAGSPCIDAGTGTAVNAGLDGRYTQVGATDSGTVDLGYHHGAGISFALADLYVATNGVDLASRGTTAANPLKTITYALSLAEPATTIHLAAGVYSVAHGEAFPIRVTCPGVRIMGADAQATVIDASGSGARVMELDYVAEEGGIFNVTLTGGRAPSGIGSGVATPTGNGGGLRLRGCRATVSNCLFTGNAAIASYQKAGGGVHGWLGAPRLANCLFTGNSSHSRGGGGALMVERCPAEVVSCVFSNNVGGTDYQGRGGAIYVVNGNRPLRFRNCLIAHNTAGPHSAGGGSGAFVYVARNVTFESCTIADNVDKNGAAYQGIGGIDRYGARPQVTVTNCILWNNGDEIVTTAMDTNVAYTCSEDTDDIGDGVIHSNPMFVDGYRLNHDELQGGGDSPCIDAGSVLAETAGLRDWSTRTDGHWDFDRLDLGYHYATDWFPPPRGTLFMMR